MSGAFSLRWIGDVDLSGPEDVDLVSTDGLFEDLLKSVYLASRNQESGTRWIS